MPHTSIVDSHPLLHPPTHLNPLQWIAEEIAPQLPKELDFVNEAHNAERAAKFFEHRTDVVVRPCIVEKWSTHPPTLPSLYTPRSPPSIGSTPSPAC